MSQTTNPSPQPELPIRQTIVNAFNSLKEKAEEVAAARTETEEAAEPEVADEAAAATEVEAPAEPEIPQAGPAPAKRPAGRPSFEKRIANLQSIQDKRINDVMSGIQQLASIVSGLQQQLASGKSAADAAPVEDDLPPEYSDPNLIRAIERQAEKVIQQKYGLDPRTSGDMQKIAILNRYKAEHSDWQALEPAVVSIVNRLPKNVPLSVEILDAAHNAAVDILTAAFTAFSSQAQPAPAEAVTKQNTQSPANGGRQITPVTASALRSQTRSLATETGENAGTDMRVRPADVKQAVLLALRGNRG